MSQIVGAYPVYGTLSDPRPVVSALASSPLVGGLEIPFDDERIGVPPGGRGDWSYVVTLIPQTMARQRSNPRFGLASPDREGRAVAVDLARTLHREVMESGHRILAVELHSAPARTASADALFESLTEITNWDWGGTQVVIEHCDEWTVAHPPEKGFLPFEAELEVAAATGTGVAVNWARSVIESRDPGTALEQVRAATARGLLRGVMFSSVSNEVTALGPAWADLHLFPAGTALAPEGSLLSPAGIASCLEAAGHAWVGFKVNTNAKVGIEARCAGLLETAQLVDRADPRERRGRCSTPG